MATASVFAVDEPQLFLATTLSVAAADVAVVYLTEVDVAVEELE